MSKGVELWISTERVRNGMPEDITPSFPTWLGLLLDHEEYRLTLMQSLLDNRLKALMLRREEEELKCLEAQKYRKEVEKTLEKINGRMDGCQDCNIMEVETANVGPRNGCPLHNVSLQEWRSVLKARVKFEEVCRMDLETTDNQISKTKDALEEEI